MLNGPSMEGVWHFPYMPQLCSNKWLIFELLLHYLPCFLCKTIHALHNIWEFCWIQFAWFNFISIMWFFSQYCSFLWWNLVLPLLHIACLYLKVCLCWGKVWLISIMRGHENVEKMLKVWKYLQFCSLILSCDLASEGIDVCIQWWCKAGLRLSQCHEGSSLYSNWQVFNLTISIDKCFIFSALQCTSAVWGQVKPKLTADAAKLCHLHDLIYHQNTLTEVRNMFKVWHYACILYLCWQCLEWEGLSFGLRLRMDHCTTSVFHSSIVSLACLSPFPRSFNSVVLFWMGLLYVLSQSSDSQTVDRSHCFIC